MNSIKDVARLAGVSYTTVSHVINGTRRVSDAARERVLQAVRDSGYVPSQVARSLRAAQTHVLGVLVPDISNPFCAEILLGVEQAAHEAGYAVVLGNTRLSDAEQTQQVDRLLGRRIDGLLAVAGVFDHGRLAQTIGAQLAGRALPVLLIDHEAEEVCADVLQADSLQAAHMATQHLTDLGHRRIACISGPLEMPISRERVEGWRLALAQVGVQPAADWLFEGDFGLAQGHRLAQACLAQGEFTAILACNDVMALGALRAAHQCGCRVPQDVSIIGIDGIELGAYLQPALTTIGEPLREVGRVAVQRLIERIGLPEQAPLRQWRRALQLIERESTGPLSPMPGGCA